MSYRPLFHITPDRGWMNDPNGFSYFGGRYHLFAQHNPYDTCWGPMHWAHYVSEDLVLFSDAGIALYPDEPYKKPNGCFSGSAIEYEGGHLLMYTVSDEDSQRQALALSKDGVTYGDYPANPIIGRDELPEKYSLRDFRDPKLFYHEGYYYALIGGRHVLDGATLLLFRGLTPQTLSFYSEFYARPDAGEGMMECPDLVFFGETALLLYSPQFRPRDGKCSFQNVHSSVYVLGKVDFTSGKFIATSEEREFDKGFDFYAAQTLSHDGHVYLSAWNNMWDRDYPSSEEGYAGGLVLTREISLHGDEIRQKFVDALERYEEDYDFLPGDSLPSSCRLRLTLDVSRGGVLYIHDGLSLRFLPEERILEVKRERMEKSVHESDGSLSRVRYAPLKGNLADFRLDIVIDNSVIEMVLGEGEYTFSMTYFTYLPPRLLAAGPMRIKDSSCRALVKGGTD